MKNIFLISLCSFSSICLAQYTRAEVIKKVKLVYDIFESNSLTFKTTNLNREKNLIIAGIVPYTISTYRFEKKGLDQPLVSVTETYWSNARSLISKYSNEQNTERKDFEEFWLSDVASHIYYDVSENPEGGYNTSQVWFNLE